MFIVSKYILWKHIEWAWNQGFSDVPMDLFLMWFIGTMAMVFSYIIMRRYQILFTHVKIYFLKDRGLFARFIFITTYAITVLIIVLFVLISISVFFVGTGVSLGIISETFIEDYSPLFIVPLFVVGITIVTLVLSEGLRYLDDLMQKYESLSKCLVSEEE